MNGPYSYVKQCALVDAHDEHDWHEHKGSEFYPRHCWGKSTSERLGELGHERQLGPDHNFDKWHADGERPA